MMKTESSKSIAECANRDRLSSPNCDHVSFCSWIHGSLRTPTSSTKYPASVVPWLQWGNNIRPVISVFDTRLRCAQSRVMLIVEVKRDREYHPSGATKPIDNIRYLLNFEMFDIPMFANIQMFKSSNVRMFANIRMFACSMIECSVIFFSKPCWRVRMLAEHERTFEHWTQMFIIRPWPTSLSLTSNLNLT